MPLSFLPAVNIAQLQDWSNVGVSETAPQFYSIGGNLFVVVRRQIPVGTADGFWCVFKSAADGVTWTLDAAIQGGAVAFGVGGALSVAVGTKIYMLSNDPGAGPAHTLQIFTYDTTVPGVISGPSANSPTSSRLNLNTQLTISALNSGALLICCTDTPNGAGNDLFENIIYTPGTNTWGAFVNISTRADPTGSQAVAVQHDPTSDQTFVLYILDNSVNPRAVQCVTLSNAGATVNTTATIFTTTRPFIETWGIPAISSDAPSGNRSIVFPFKTGGGPFVPLRVAYVDVATFATATETVDDSTDLPAGWFATPYSQLDISGWAALDVSGTLYVVFATDNGNNNDPTSQSALYAKARVAGAWGGLQQLFLSAVPREMSQPYPSTFKGQPAIQFNLFDPTLGPNNLAALTSWILLAPAPAGGSITIGPSGGGGRRTGQMGNDDICRDIFANHEYSLLRRAMSKGLLCSPVSDLSLANVVAGQQEPIFKSGAIVTPNKGTFETQVLNFDLEKGFSAVITGLAWNYVGAGFQDGSGSILWLLMVDYRFWPGYAQVTQAFGDDQQPRPVGKGIPVGPGQNVQILVTIPAASPITVGGNTQIFGAVSGFKFPVK